MNQEDTYKSQEEKKIMMSYLDNKEYQSKFLLTPNIIAEEDYGHLDKNLAITNLKDNPKLHINEVGELRSIARGLHVLNRLQHIKTKTKNQFIGYKDETQEDGTILRTPIYQEIDIPVSNFPKTYHQLKSEIYTLTNATAARNGHRMRAAITNRLERDESLQDRTETKSKWAFGNKKQT